MEKRKFQPKKAETREVIYYTDELNDEFSTAVIEPIKIDGNFKYVDNSLFKRFTHFFWYRIIAHPIAFLYTKIKFGHKIENANLLKKARKTGYFLYGNHTQDIGDAFIPNMLDKAKDKYVIVHPNNVSIPGIGKVAVSLGAIPLPDDLAAFRNFSAAIETRIKQKKAVVIYPEAHIWPRYTGIRPFTDVSFTYPVQDGVPAVAFVTTYRRRKWFSDWAPRLTVTVSEPFWPDPSLSKAEARQKLRDQVYDFMCAQAARPDNCAYYEYVQREE